MSKRIPQRGDIYLIDPNPCVGKEMRDKHRFVVITPKEINSLGISTTVPITSGGEFARDMGLAVSILGYETNGVAVCNQVRSFDIQAREKEGTAKFIERIDDDITMEIINRVISVIDPA